MGLDRKIFSVVTAECGVEPPPADTREGRAVRSRFTLSAEKAGLSFAVPLQWQQAAAQFLSTVLECVEQATLQVVVILLLEVEM